MSAPHAMTHNDTTSTTMGRRISAGVLGGLAGGLVFGIMMAMGGILAVIAGLVGSESAVAGFVVHMGISTLIGLGLTIPFAGMLTGYGRGAVVGLLYGAVWWVLGPLLLMPLMMGMPLLTLGPSSMTSLVGHLVFGLVLGLVAAGIFMSRR